MIKLGIDVDGVLRNIVEEINKIFKQHYPDKIFGDIAYEYDFPHIHMPIEEKMNIIFNKYPSEIFSYSEPYPNVIEQFLDLVNWSNENNIKLVCATTQEKHLISLTYFWLGKYNFNFEEIHITNKKGEIGLDYLIDDAPHNYQNWIDNGNNPENFFLMDRDWNQKINIKNRIYNITDIKKFIK